jgi:hypothetical protein
MIWDLITGLVPNIWPYLLAVGGLVVAFLTGRAGGAAKAKRKQAEDTVKGVQAGAKGAAKAEADLRGGKSPEDIVRGNDAKWR